MATMLDPQVTESKYKSHVGKLLMEQRNLADQREDENGSRTTQHHRWTETDNETFTE